MDDIEQSQFDNWVDANYKELRYGFEEMTLDACDHWNRQTISECNDGRYEYCVEAWKEQAFN